MAAMPQQSQKRKDPVLRHVAGVRANEIEVQNKAPGRHYVLVALGSGQNNEPICPEMYEEVGYRFEYWPKFQGLDGHALAAAQRTALKFKGRAIGRPGELMTSRGHALMSADADHVKEMYASSQRELDPVEKSIKKDANIARNLRSEQADELADHGMDIDTATDADMRGAVSVPK